MYTLINLLNNLKQNCQGYNNFEINHNNLENYGKLPNLTFLSES